MAQKVVTIYTDDLTGEESSEATTHHLSLDGVEYEIDLAPDSFDQRAMLNTCGSLLTEGGVPSRWIDR
ncbi:histone-like nucleoid-structuring protein Lsr2 [Streptomyces noursei]|uniref:Lsr2 dimerization domain-containing protein n=1 Tax=Streptomyces noursei TaxID=1971 RepID=UPI0033F5B99A